jgi:hypothetical protein
MRRKPDHPSDCRCTRCDERRVFWANNPKPPMTEPSTAAMQGTTIIRMRFALLMLRKFAMGEDYDSLVLLTVKDWIDSGMNGPIPWPDSPFFARWAAEQGWSNVNGFVGFKYVATLWNAQVAQ